MYSSMMIGLPLDLDPNFVNVDIGDQRLFQDGSISVEKLEYYENENNKASKVLCCVQELQVFSLLAWVQLSVAKSQENQVRQLCKSAITRNYQNILTIKYCFKLLENAFGFGFMLPISVSD